MVHLYVRNRMQERAHDYKHRGRKSGYELPRKTGREVFHAFSPVATGADDSRIDCSDKPE